MVFLQELGLLAEPFRLSHKVEVELDHTRGFMLDIAGHSRGLDLAVMESASAGEGETHTEHN